MLNRGLEWDKSVEQTYFPNSGITRLYSMALPVVSVTVSLYCNLFVHA